MIFLTDTICVNHFGTGCMKKKVLDNRALFRAILGFAMYGHSAFLVFSAT